jgi:tRNA(Ile)-lysidine synthase TilS/MesJ
LSIDEGISGYRDDSLETVKRNRDQYGIPLKILSYEVIKTRLKILSVTNLRALTD